MTELQLWDLILAFFMPLLVALVVQSHWDLRAQAITMFLVCLIITVLEHIFILKDFSLDGDLVKSFLTIMVATIAFYKGWWKPTGVAPAIEERTTLHSVPPNSQ